jgi:hypothetical protein
MNPQAPVFIQLMKHPVRNRLFLFLQLPSAFFSGVRVKEINEKKCAVAVPYKWFSKNPFRSTYFACLSMAAEMSTGSLAMLNVYKRKPAVSMLVIKVESEYFKKATSKTTFICEDGMAFEKAVDECVVSGEPRIVKARSVGKNEAGEIVAEFFITWSFKARR